MKRKILISWVLASLLVIGLVVLALSFGPRGSNGRSAASETTSVDGETITVPGGAGSTSDASDDGASVAGATDERADETPSSPADDDSSSTGPNDDGSGGSPVDGPDLPVALPDVPDDPTDALCSTEERQAIEATAAGMRASILDEAEAAKDDLLRNLGLGSLLGGVSDAVQEQLDGIDDGAQLKLDHVDEKVAHAIVVCEAGGDPFSAI
jgi:hypothetical protein